jgi:hypothetical protein
MKEARYANGREMWFFALFALIPIAIYFGPLGFALWSKKSNTWWLLAFALFCCWMMFNWRVKSGEIGHVMCFGFDTGLRTGPGNYLMPSLAPFLRGMDLVLGWSVEPPSDQHEGNTHNIRHFYDQRAPSYRINTETGMLGALLGQLISNFFLWLFDSRAPDGKFKYYKYGGLGYVVCWIATGFIK